MSWPTGDNIPTGLVSVRFLVPDDGWIIETLTGALLNLLSVFSWDATGEVTAAQAAALYSQIWASQERQALTVGQIVCFAADNMQWIGQDPANGASQYLKCEGQTLNKITYADLYLVIGDTFGSTLFTFNLPDLRGRAVVDAGHGIGLSTRALGEDFGEEDHTLITAEIPSHSHSEITAVSTIINGGLEAPASSAFPSVGTTGSTGGGGAHNNMQPSLVLIYYIQVSP